MVTDTPAMYWTPHANDMVKCELCPHYCLIAPGHYGRCHTRININGGLYTTNYGKVVSYAYDPIEKKPIHHYRHGSTIFSIGTFGCNFTCDFCQKQGSKHLPWHEKSL